MTSNDSHVHKGSPVTEMTADGPQIMGYDNLYSAVRNEKYRFKSVSLSYVRPLCVTLN